MGNARGNWSITRSILAFGIEVGGYPRSARWAGSKLRGGHFRDRSEHIVRNRGYDFGSAPKVLNILAHKGLLAAARQYRRAGLLRGFTSSRSAALTVIRHRSRGFCIAGRSNALGPRNEHRVRRRGAIDPEARRVHARRLSSSSQAARRSEMREDFETFLAWSHGVARESPD